MFNLLKSLLFGTPINYIHPSVKIGKGTKIWHFATILSGVKLGANISIGSCTELGHGTTVGDNSRIGFNCFFPPNSRIGSNVFVAPNVTCADDAYPKVNNPGYQALPPILEDGCSIGAGVVLLPGVKVGAGSLIGAGAVISKDVPPNIIIRGEPSRIKRAKIT